MSSDFSYLVSGLRDSRGKTGNRLSQAVDCCLSEDIGQAEACQNFYLQRCLEADNDYEPPARDWCPISLFLNEPPACMASNHLPEMQETFV